MSERMPGRNIRMRVESYNAPSPSIQSIKIPQRNVQPPKPQQPKK